jgi:carbon-monoxide dehydrogenase small subunit
MNGLPIKACTILAQQCEGQNVLTIEGLATNGKLHPMQEAYRENHALQCGFCTPGMVMASIGIVDRHRKDSLDEKTVRHELEGNLCRCTGYHNIVKAILAAYPVMKSQG